MRVLGRVHADSAGGKGRGVLTALFREARRYRIRLLLLLLFPLAMLLNACSRAHAHFTETVYSRHIYPVLSGVLSKFTVYIPVCVTELVLCALALGALAGIVLCVIFRRKLTLRRLAAFLLTLLCVAAAGYFLFYALWGFNYNREPLAANLGYRAAPDTKEELASAFTMEAGAVDKLLDSGKIPFQKDHTVYPKSLFAMERQTVDGYNRLAAGNKLINRNYVRPKGVLLSLPWCYTGTEGIFIPFFYEPCINTVTPPFMLPFNMSHETAHFKGFAREEEANFLAYLSAAANSDPYFQYSGHMGAIMYLSNALYETDQALWRNCFRKLDSRAVADLNYYNAYCDRFAGPVEQASQNANNSYLQSQGQPQGVLSYDEFVDLLLARNRTLGLGAGNR